MQFVLTTLGCKVNQYESMALTAALTVAGFAPASAIEAADVFILNSCTVTENSDRKTRQLLSSAKRKNPHVITVLTGCFPQAYPEDAKRLGADIICGTAQRSALPALISEFAQKRIVITRIAPLPDVYEEFCAYGAVLAPRTRAFIKVQEGCDCNCAYCIVPRARGKPRSRPLADVRAEAAASARAGFKEIVLTGINLTLHSDLCGAVSAVAEYAERVRLSSVEPDLLTDAVLERLSRESKLCPHFHLSLQSGSDSVLRRMGRRYTSDEYYAKVCKIRALFGENCALTTDMMTGFPGETDAEFAESISFARKVNFAKIHVFPFSARPGTRAADMENQVPERVRRERRDRLLDAAGEMRQNFLAAQVGKTLKVLVEKENFGHAENYTPVKILHEKAQKNEILNVEIVRAENGFCIGKKKGKIMSVYRIFTEKKPEISAESAVILAELRNSLLVKSIENLRVINLFEVEGLSRDDFDKAASLVFSSPQTDLTYAEFPALGADERAFAVEFLPGQYDQRADSAAQSCAVLCGVETPLVKSKKIYVIKGAVSDVDLAKIKRWLINSVEARETDFAEKLTLKTDCEVPAEVEIIEGFTDMPREELNVFLSDYGIAMDIEDIVFCQNYFKGENRNPTVTEIKMLDTYWSDHCRHTTFLTHVDDVQIDADFIAETYEKYLANKTNLGRADKPVTLMDLATAGMRKLRTDGLLSDLDESEEINACCVKIDVDGEPWLLYFKNETHNHPTEIEPFGGGATCLGGAIRDVLSGRAYAHQAMRISGCSNPLLPVADTIPGKLPPRKITTTAAAGYSSYGNQVGISSGHLTEIYHDGYMAKRMELGALVGAVREENVVRETPAEGDAVILLGGKTGRDGCGGATGSSKSHDTKSLEKSGAEVQKGDALIGRKMLRLFRNPAVAKMIKRCNDFGAGGVSVAISELADGLSIDLDKVPPKYPGLDGTELAISESQERMAVVVDKNNAEKFINFAADENLEATIVAEITSEPRLKMNWNGKEIVNLSREFLNSNGAEKHTRVRVTKPKIHVTQMQNNAENWKKLVSELNICSQRGLAQRFDASASAGTVLMPLGGKTQLTPAQAMAAKIPGAQTKISSLMSWGFNPVISQQSPYHGGALAVVESVAKIVAAGGKSEGVRLTFQEYFERLKDEPERWGKPFAALLGAYEAQLALEAPSVGGKDSMSGTFEDIDVPPTLVSFAVTTANADNIISPEFKQAGSKIMYIAPKYDENYLPDFADVKRVFDIAEREIARKNALSVWTLSTGGIAEGVFKMCLGNRIGANLQTGDLSLFTPCYGAFIIEAKEEFAGAQIIGQTTADYVIKCNDVQICIAEHEALWESVLEPIFPSKTPPEPAPQIISHGENGALGAPAHKTQKPRVLIPVFPGTHGEYDIQRAFEREGADTEFFVMKNLSASAIGESFTEFARLAQTSNIIAIPGGISAGGEPDGAGKLIAVFLQNAQTADAVQELLRRGGLTLGIGDGFNALLRAGLLSNPSEGVSLTANKIGRHQSQMVYTRISSVKSPWLSLCKVGEVYAAPFSSGEGRIIISDEAVQRLIQNGQIAAQYADLGGNPSMETAFNPAGSMQAVEGIMSADGQILGKMAHNERVIENCAINFPGEKNLPLFKAGVEYFR